MAYPVPAKPMMPPIQPVALNQDIALPMVSGGTTSATSAGLTVVVMASEI